jgi:uncharacterized membrane protein YoaK (UPF0700 family)
MVCYLVPTAAAIAHHIMRKNITSWNESMNHLWLNLLLIGGAIFGIVDHLWNGEIFLLGEKPIMDILLGITITAAIFAAWTLLVFLEKTKTYKPAENPN